MELITEVKVLSASVCVCMCVYVLCGQCEGREEAGVKSTRRFRGYYLNVEWSFALFFPSFV